LQEVLGRGGLGVVYRAVDHLIGNTVALKHVTTAPADLMFSSSGTDDADSNQALALFEKLGAAYDTEQARKLV
jgi:serine/threonine protein kinase